MNATSKRDVFFSFFMFTADLKPQDPDYTETLIRHLKALTDMGYNGFDVHIAPQPPTVDHKLEVDSYAGLKKAFDKAGLADVKFTTNVGTTRTFDPTSPYEEQRTQALAYLKSRVDITRVLGGDSIMSGPFLYPYGVFPLTDDDEPLWSDALQDWIRPRYLDAQPIVDEVGQYAAGHGVKLAIEPVDHWEQAAPNMVGEVLRFLDGVSSRQVGVCVDSAHVVLGSSGPDEFRRDVLEASRAGRLNYAQVSAPDRGAVHDSWIPWREFLGAIVPGYDGPLLIEVFNAIPAFLSSLRLTRRKFWIPGEDEPVPGVPDAYEAAAASIDALRGELGKL